MAKGTGHKIADSLRLEHRCAHRVVACSLFIALLTTQSLGSSAAAAQPGAKSRRSVAQSHSPGGDKAKADQEERGLFRSVFGGKSKQRITGPEFIDELPLERLTDSAKQSIFAITKKPTLYRRLPEKRIACDPDLFLFLTRHPETIVGIWDVMGITNVKTERIGPYELAADDGSGTTCRINLIYGDRNLHVYVADGEYEGKYAQKPVTGKGVFILKSNYEEAPDGTTVVLGTLDCYVKFDNLGADLLARSFGGLIGHSADHNFSETAKFMEQVARVCHTNPTSMLELADQLPQVDSETRTRFARLISTVAIRHLDKQPRAAKLIEQKSMQSMAR